MKQEWRHILQYFLNTIRGTVLYHSCIQTSNRGTRSAARMRPTPTAPFVIVIYVMTQGFFCLGRRSWSPFPQEREQKTICQCMSRNLKIHASTFGTPADGRKHGVGQTADLSRGWIISITSSQQRRILWISREAAQSLLVLGVKAIVEHRGERRRGDWRRRVEQRRREQWRGEQRERHAIERYREQRRGEKWYRERHCGEQWQRRGDQRRGEKRRSLVLVEVSKRNHSRSFANHLKTLNEVHLFTVDLPSIKFSMRVLTVVKPSWSNMVVFEHF